MTTREQFLERVRQAVVKGNQAGVATTLPARGEIGYQGAGADPIGRFCEMLTAAGGRPYRVVDSATAIAQVMQLVRERQIKRVLLSADALVESLGLAEELRSLGLDVTVAGKHTDPRDPYFAADLGISGVDYCIAETGSLVMRSKAVQPRSASLLPPVHIAVADVDQLLPDLFDLFERLSGKELPACVSLITGPSKTGDIELKLVTGVHGPGEVHVVLIEG